MDEKEAWRFFHDYYKKAAPTQLDKDAFVEASEFLLWLYTEGQGDERRVILYNLAAFYYSEGQFPLARKYFEYLADEAEKDDDQLALSMARTSLGFYYYYGHDGAGPDYKKAYSYACGAPDDLRAQWLKIAVIGFGDVDSGITVSDYGEQVFRFHDEVMSRRVDGVWSIPVPEAGMLLADFLLRAFEEEKEAHDRKARSFLFQRLLHSKDPDDLLLMHQIVDMDPLIIPEESEDLDIYDLFWLLHDNTVTFMAGGREFSVTSQSEKGRQAIEFGGKWYRSPDEFFWKAEICHNKLNFIADQISGISVTENR